ncbi:MAG: metallophosphoesterase [Anaerolineales bacterium]
MQLSQKIIIFLTIFSILFANYSTPVHAKTPSQQSGITTFAVIGDYGLAGQAEADVANLVKNWNPDFIVTLGDNNYQKGAAESIDPNIGQYYHDYISPYRGKYGNGSPTKRFFPALGNHDWGSGDANAYFNYFSFYNKQGYYDFVQGPIHFFMLDSDPHEPDGTSSTSEQAKWLRKGLAASTATFNVVILHHPPYSSGQHGSNAYTQWPYKAWGADVVLAGHDHIYERLLVGGLPYFVNGIGGAELYGFSSIVPGSQVRFNQDYGAMRVETNGLTMKFQAYSRTGILIDEYTIGQAPQTIPRVTSITRSSPSPTNASLLNFTVTFSEAVNGVDLTDFTLATSPINDASINTITGSGTSYTVSVNSGTTSGTLQLNLLDNDSITNTAGTPLGGIGNENGNFSTGEIYTLDKTMPSVLSIQRASPNPTSAASVDFNVTFSEPVTGVDISDFNLFSSTNNNAFITTINGAGNLYTISVNTGNNNTDLRLDLINNNSIVDVVGNGLNSNFTNGEIYSINKTIPSVISITPVSANPSNAASVDFAVTFSEAVSGVDVSDFSISASNISGSISNIRGSGNSYIVSVATGNGQGTLRLDLVDNDSIVNGSGVPLGSLGAGNGEFL